MKKLASIVISLAIATPAFACPDHQQAENENQTITAKKEKADKDKADKADKDKAADKAKADKDKAQKADKDKQKAEKVSSK